MNLLGIDYGKKRIGLAIGDSETNIALPFGILKNQGEDFVIQEIKKICRSKGVEKVIIGVPITLSGAVGLQAKEVLKFVNFLKNNLSVAVETEDERFTSAMVDKLMAESGVKERDAVAAMIILQSYLDRKK